MSRPAERHLDLSSTGSGPPIDQADAIGAILGQPVLGVAHEQHFGEDHETDGAEVAAVVSVLESAVGIVEPRIEHLLHVHNGDASAPSVLEELGVVHGPMMVDHIRRPTVLAEHDVCGIADRFPVEAIRLDLGSAHDGVGRLVVLPFQGRLEVDRVDPRISAAGGQDERIVGEREVRSREDRQ